MSEAESTTLPPQLQEVLLLLSNGGFTNPQRKALTFLKCFIGSASFVGASLLIFMVLRKRKQNRSETPTFYRFLLGLSIYDVLYEFWIAIGVMAVPKSPLVGGYGAIGTQESCTAQGFFTTLALGSFIYNAGLSIYYVLIIRYGLSEERISKFFEPVVHFTAAALPLAFGISGVASDIYNPPIIAPPEIGCFAYPYPPECVLKGLHTCERGYHYAAWLITYFGIQFLFVLVVVVMSLVLYWTIRTCYRSVNQYASQESEQMKQRTRAVACQAFLFAATCVYTNIWNYLIVMSYRLQFPIPVMKVFLVNGIIGFSSTGFFNFLIYTRPRYNRLRQRKPDLGRWGALMEVIFGERNPDDARRCSLLALTVKQFTTSTAAAQSAAGTASMERRRWSALFGPTISDAGDRDIRGWVTLMTIMFGGHGEDRVSADTRRFSSLGATFRRRSSVNAAAPWPLDLVEEAGTAAKAISRSSEQQEDDYDDGGSLVTAGVQPAGTVEVEKVTSCCCDMEEGVLQGSHTMVTPQVNTGELKQNTNRSAE